MYEYMKDEQWSPPAAPGDRSLYKCVSMTSDNVQVTQLCRRLQLARLLPTPPPRISPEPESGVTENVL